MTRSLIHFLEKVENHKFMFLPTPPGFSSLKVCLITHVEVVGILTDGLSACCRPTHAQLLTFSYVNRNRPLSFKTHEQGGVFVCTRAPACYGVTVNSR